MRIFEAMKISTKCGKLASNWQTTEIWSQRKSLITLLVTMCFQIFFLANPQECKRRLAILDDIAWGNASFIQFVISANACFLCHFTWRVILRFFFLSSDFGGLPVRCKFSTFCRYFHRFKNLHTQDWLTFSIFAINSCVQLLLVNFRIFFFCPTVNSLTYLTHNSSVVLSAKIYDLNDVINDAACLA